MSEIKCPHCGEVFKVDEQGYAAIAIGVLLGVFGVVMLIDKL